MIGARDVGGWSRHVVGDDARGVAPHGLQPYKPALKSQPLNNIHTLVTIAECEREDRAAVAHGVCDIP